MNGFMRSMATWTIILFPALAMWIPVGAEVWLLLVLSSMLSAWMLGWRPTEKIWMPNVKHIGYALAGIVSIKALSMLWSIAHQLTWHHTKLYLHLLLYIPLYVLFIQAPNAHQLFFRKALPLAVVPGAAWALFAIWDAGSLFARVEFEGATKNSLVLAIFLTYVICNLVFDYWDSRDPANLFLLSLALMILVANGKRSALLVTTLVLLYAVWLNSYRGVAGSAASKGSLRILLTGSIQIFCVAALFFWFMGDSWALGWKQVKLFLTSGYQGGSFDTRLELIRVAWEGFLANPWIGAGAGTAKAVVAKLSTAPALQQFNHYHNVIIQALADLGVLGFVFSAWCLWVVHKGIRHLACEGAIRLTAHTIIPVAILYGLINLSFGNILFHLLFVYLLALVSQKSHSLPAPTLHRG